MRKIIAIIAVMGLLMSGCLEVQSQPPLPSTTMSSWGPLGGFSVSSGATCLGKATLNGGHASVSDPCFTSDDNIVMCTDTTAPNPIRCTPASGYLSISGTADDIISYVRVH
jgi:hypothetical protein